MRKLEESLNRIAKIIEEARKSSFMFDPKDHHALKRNVGILGAFDDVDEAKKFSDKNKPSMVILGDDDEVWVVTMARGKELLKGGYEIGEAVSDDELKRYGIYELVDGLTIEQIKKDFPWLLKAKMKVATIGMDSSGDYIIWYGGTWVDGIWHVGTWKAGVWKNGVWSSGIWEGGVFENGSFEGGTWKGGVWEGGKFKGGKWADKKNPAPKNEWVETSRDRLEEEFDSNTRNVIGKKIEKDIKVIFNKYVIDKKLKFGESKFAKILKQEIDKLDVRAGENKCKVTIHMQESNLELQFDGEEEPDTLKILLFIDCNDNHDECLLVIQYNEEEDDEFSIIGVRWVNPKYFINK